MTYFLSLGSNLGDREVVLEQAVSHIAERIGIVTARSAFFYSEPWGFDSEHGFCNMCIKVVSELEPLDFLTQTEAIERLLGRTQKSLHGQYHDRIIDIDILQVFLSDGTELHITCPRLTIPHPLMHEREFVLVPLKMIQ